MGQKTRLFSLSDRRLIRAILLVSSLLFYALPGVLANSGTSSINVINGRGCQEVAQAPDMDSRPSYTLSAGYAPEEALLDSAYNFLKARDINGAVSNLQELTREFPDNEDYSLCSRWGKKNRVLSSGIATRNGWNASRNILGPMLSFLAVSQKRVMVPDVLTS